MPVHNSEIASKFDHLADLLEIKDANEFRVRAYRNAANTIRDQSRSIASMVKEGDDLSELPDIGDDLAGKITTIVRTGKFPLLEEVAEDMDEAIVDATRIPGIGQNAPRRCSTSLTCRRSTIWKTPPRKARSPTSVALARKPKPGSRRN